MADIDGCASNRARAQIIVLIVLAWVTGCAQSSGLSRDRAASVPPFAPQTKAETPPAPPVDRFEARYGILKERVEELMHDVQVPGLALAIVHGDSLVYARGFGYSDLERAKEATPRTVFSVGAASQAFTALRIGMLVDAKKMSWEDPIAQHLPEFSVAVRSEDENAQATIRDALSHRTGFAHMEVLSASGTVPRGDFLLQASRAEPAYALRAAFEPNDVVVTAAGEASARVAGVSWGKTVRQEIFDPLGMKSSFVGTSDAGLSADLAAGYTWDASAQKFQPVEVRERKEIGPARGIHSNALDMSAWIRLLLSRGTFAGKRLLQAKTVEETWSAQISVGPNIDYGMGWYIETFNGSEMVHQGGVAQGSTVMVSLIPEENLGFVLLANGTSPALHQEAARLVYGTLLGDPPGGREVSEDLSRYEGDFVADFGSFSGKTFTVSSRGGALFVAVPGQKSYELEPENEQGKRPFVAANSLAVSFHEEAGDVVSMHLFQGGYEFELLREGYTPAADVPLDAIEPLLGPYVSDSLGRADVLIRNNRLAIDIPGQMVYELFPPDEEGRWSFRVKPDISVEFVPSDEPTKLVLHQDGGTFDLLRDGYKGAVVPSMATLRRLRNSAAAERAVEALGVVKVTGRLRFLHAGVEGTFTTYAAPDGRWHTRIDLGRYGWRETMVGTDGGWSASSRGAIDELGGDRLRQARLLHPLAYARDLGQVHADVAVTGSATQDGREVTRLLLRNGSLPGMTALCDPSTGNMVGLHYGALRPGPEAIATREVLGDYRPALGLRLPFVIDRNTARTGTIRFFVEEYATLEEGAEHRWPAGPPSLGV